MQDNYNINQLSLAMVTDYQPKENHPAYYIHQLVESLAISKPSIMGQPREYNPRMLLKLVLLAYSYDIVSCRKIERFARENIVAMWLTQEQRSTYRTIARFIISKELTEMIQASFKDFHDYLQKAGLIDEASFIDGTKILANANKSSFVWKKRTIKYSDLNVAKARKSFSSSNTYSRRKYDVETVFGNLKAYLGCTRFTVRGLKKVKKQIGIALMALNHNHPSNGWFAHRL